MIIHELKQGEKLWHDHRVTYRNASEAAAMLNMSKYMTRNELLHLKKTGETKPVSEFLQKRFDEGHKAEALARPFAEEITGSELFPLTGSLENSLFSASFDGITLFHNVVWEHKLINAELKESLEKDVIPDQYKPQLEQQLMVSGAEKAVFMASDGTKENMLCVAYYPDESLRDKIINGWSRFDIDLETYEVKEEIKVVAEVTNSFPIMTYSVDNSIVVSNLKQCLATVKEIASSEMVKELVTDQDFADKEQLNKDVKKARTSLKKLVADVKAGFESVAAFEELVKEYDSVLQKMQSSGEKQVKQEKERIKEDLIKKAENNLAEHFNKRAIGLDDLDIIQYFRKVDNDFDTAIRGKSKLSSIENAIDSTLSAAKTEVNIIMDGMLKNAEYLKSVGNEHLFKDASSIINYEFEPFKVVVDSRIQAETDRKAEAERLAKEAQDKAIQLAEAKAKVEAEQAIKQAEMDKQDALEAQQIAIAAEREKERREADLLEQQLIDDEEQERKAEEKRAANKNHQKRINNEAVSGLVEFGLDDKQAKDLVKAIALDKISNLKINY